MLNVQDFLSKKFQRKYPTYFTKCKYKRKWIIDKYFIKFLLRNFEYWTRKYWIK